MMPSAILVSSFNYIEVSSILILLGFLKNGLLDIVK